MMRLPHFFLLSLAGAAAIAVACSSSDDAAPIGGDAGPSPDAAAPRDELAACRAYITAQCNKGVTCKETPSADSCLEYVDLCPAFYFAPGSTRTIDGLFGCAAEVDAMTCDDYLAGKRPESCGPGTRKAGEGCRFASQCESAACGTDLRTGRCGTCVAVAKTGEPCDGTIRCENGYCDSQTERCVAFPAPLGEGAPCNGRDRSCSGGLGCVASSPSAMEGICTRLPGPGAPCAALVQLGATFCASGAFCKPPGDGGVGTCTAALPNGQICGDPVPYPGDVCRDGQCVLGSGPPTCLAFREPNESCSDTRQCNPETAYCANGTCRTFPRVGESCAGAICAEGTCTPEDGGARCYAKPNPGGIGDSCDPPLLTCRTFFDCVTGKCQNRDITACDEKRD
jgi:hypothetical protein